jgi:hypothetical protein
MSEYVTGKTGKPILLGYKLHLLPSTYEVSGKATLTKWSGLHKYEATMADALAKPTLLRYTLKLEISLPVKKPSHPKQKSHI